MILFVLALPQELKIIKQEIKNLELKNKKIDFLLTWVWNLNISYQIKEYINKKWKPDFIVNIWVCWKVNNFFNDFFQVSRIKYLSNNKELLPPIYCNFFDLKSISCSDKIITSENEIINESYVDMESYWFSYICEKENIPYALIKKPFDIIWNDSKKVSLIELENTLKWCNYIKIFDEIEIFLSKNKKNDIIEKEIINLKENLKLTFSETEILKKYINSKIAFWNKIDFIFTQLNNYDKKDLFLQINIDNNKG